MTNTIALTVDRTALFNALTYIRDVIENKNVIPILSHFLLETSEGKLTITGTDMDIAVTMELEAKVTKIGSLTINSKTFYEMIKKAPESTINISGDAEKGKVLIKYNKSRFNSPCLAVEDYPVLAFDMEKVVEVNIKSAQLFNLLYKTKFASSSDEIKYYLQGVHLSVSETQDSLVALATDGAKLARAEIVIPELKYFGAIIIPSKAIDIICKILKKPTENFKLYVSDTKLKLCYENTVVTSKLIDGKFPDVSSIIPNDFSDFYGVEIKKDDFIKAIDRISIVNAETTSSITLLFNKELLTISASSEENGSGEEDVEIISLIENLKVHVNSVYLHSIINNINNDIISIKFFETSKLIQFDDPKNDKELYLLSPMRA